MTAFDKKLERFHSIVAKNKFIVEPTITQLRINKIQTGKSNEYVIPESDIPYWIENGWKYNQEGRFMSKRGRENVFTDLVFKNKITKQMKLDLKKLTNRLNLQETKLKEHESKPFSLDRMELTKPLQLEIEGLRKEIRNLKRKI